MRRGLLALVVGIALSACSFAPIVSIEQLAGDADGAVAETPAQPVAPTGASGGSGDPSPPVIPPPTPIVITSLSTLTLPQGASGTVSLQGSGLNGVTVTVRGPSASTLSNTISLGSEASLALSIKAHHGATIGAYSVVLARDGLTTEYPNAVTVSAITVTQTGNDTALGSSLAPFRTLTHALTVASSGDTVVLGAGDYSTAGGEAFPVLADDSFTAPSGPTSVPTGVRIEGAGRALTHLLGTGTTQSAGLVIAASAQLARLSVEGFRQNIVVQGGPVVFDDVGLHDASRLGLFVGGTASVQGTVAVTGNYRGVMLAGSSSTTFTSPTIAFNDKTPVEDCTVAESGGIWLVGSASLAINGGSINDNYGHGLWNKSSGVITLTGVNIEGNNDHPPNTCKSQVLTEAGSMTLHGVHLHHGGQYLLNARGSADVVAEADTILEFGNAVALQVAGNASFTARDTELRLGEGTGNAVVVLGGTANVDFGTASSPGNNVIEFDHTLAGVRFNRDHVIIDDLRDACQGAVSYSATPVSFVTNGVVTPYLVPGGGGSIFDATIVEPPTSPNVYPLHLVNPGSAGCSGPQDRNRHEVWP